MDEIRPEDAALVAGLMAGVASQLNKIDQNITSTSPNIKGLKINPREQIKAAVNQIRRHVESGTAPVLEHVPSDPAAVVDLNAPPQPPPVVQPVFEQPRPVMTSPMPAQTRNVPGYPMGTPPAGVGMPLSVVIMDTETVKEFRDRISALERTNTQLLQYICSLHTVEERFCNVLERALQKGLTSITMKMQNEPVVKKQEEPNQ